MLDKGTNPSTRTMTYYALLFVTPENKPIGPIVLKLLNSLPNETLRQLISVDDKKTSSNSNGEQPLNPEELRAVSVIFSYINADPLTASGHTKIEVPYLIEIALGDYPSTIRVMAVGTLRTLEFDAKSAVPALRKLLTDKDRLVRISAFVTLLDIEPDPKLVPELIESLELKGKQREDAEKEISDLFKQQEPKRQIRREFVRSKGDLTKVVQKLKYGSGFQRRQAIQYLGWIGLGAKSLIPELRKALRDPDEDTRRMAAEAIKQIETPTPVSRKN